MRAKLEPPEDIEQGRKQRQELLVEILKLASADATKQRTHELEVVVWILRHRCESEEGITLTCGSSSL
jgi:predicted transcriptional regulator